MLSDFGFSPELYIITKRYESIDIEFDDRGAVDYFRQQTEIEYPNLLFVEYVKNGKRHMAKVQYW